jgi:hypothetical protein
MGVTQHSQHKAEKSHSGLHGMIDDLKEKLHDTKLHDAKIALVHKKSVTLISSC